MVAHRPRARAAPARHHVRPPRRRALARVQRRLHDRGDGRRRGVRARRGGRGARPRLRHLARRDGRPAARAAPPRTRAVARPRRDEPGRPARRARPTTRCSRSSARRLRMRSDEAARASVPFNYGPRCRRDHVGAHRGGHRAAAREPVQRPRVPRPALCGGAAQLLGAAAADRRPDARRARAPRPHGPRRERPHPRRAHPRRAPGVLDESGHLYPTEEPAVDEAIAEFLAARDEEDAA